MCVFDVCLIDSSLSCKSLLTKVCAKKIHVNENLLEGRGWNWNSQQQGSIENDGEVFLLCTVTHATFLVSFKYNKYIYKKTYLFSLEKQ